jgi:HSP20 family protein
MTTTLARWNPETDFVRGRYDRLFNQMLQGFLGSDEATEGVANRNWIPAVDIRETEEALLFDAELPGMTKAEIGITLENNVLTIAGEHKFEKEAKGETFHRIERSYGAFSRSFTVPTGIHVDKVKAEFANGVLHITLPKQDESKAHKIDIR